jgi:hypothetical protein
MGGYPALAIKGPEPLLQQYGQAQAIVGAQQRQQMGEIEIQNARMQQQSTQAIQQAFMDNKGDIGQILQNPPAGVLPKDLLELRNVDQAYRLQAAQLTESNLKNESTLDSKAGDILQSVKTIADPQVRQQSVAAHLRVLAGSQNPLDQQIAAHLAQSIRGVSDWSDTGINQMESAIGMRTYYNNQEIEQRTKEQTAQGAQLRGQAAAALVPSEQAKNVAQAGLATTEQAQKGQVTPLEVYKEQQANYRAELARAATNANEIGRQGIGTLEKLSEDYAKYSRQADAVKTAISQGLAGNQVAASLAPLGAAVFEMKANGDIARVNPQVFADVKGAGSIVQRINGAIGQLQGTGPLSPQLSKDLSDLIDKYQDVKYDSYKKQADYTIKLHKDPTTNQIGGVQAHDMPILAKDGTVTTPAQAGITPPKAKFTVPGGAPAAPKEDGHTLRMNGKDIAVSKGGEWVAP